MARVWITTKRSSFNRTTRRQASRRSESIWSTEGKAYRDFTPKEERDDANVKQGHRRPRARHAAEGIDQRSNPFRDLPEEESDRRAAAGEPFAIRLKVAREGKSRFDDIVYGQQERDLFRD